MPKPSVTPPTSGQGSIQRGGWLAEADVLAWGRELVGHLWHSVFIGGNNISAGWNTSL